MNALKYVAVLAVAGMLGLGAGVVSAQETKTPEAGKAPVAAKPAATATGKEAKEPGRNLTARGELTAVDSTATPPTVTLKVLKGKQSKTMTIEVPSSAKILEGKTTKAMADLTVGERVQVKYDRTQAVCGVITQPANSCVSLMIKGRPDSATWRKLTVSRTGKWRFITAAVSPGSMRS